MTFRCPYCKEPFGPDPVGKCPHCGKDMVVPGHLRKTTFKDRQKMRDRIAKDAERKRRSLLANDIKPGQSPVIIGLMIMTLVVLGGLLIGRINMSAAQTSRPTREMRAEGELQALRIATERFKIDCGRYPTPEEGLKALVQNPGLTNWGGHYVNIVKPDPWRTPYYYTLTNGTITLLTQGPDQLRGTDDDIHAPIPTPDEIQPPKQFDQ